MPVVVKMRQPGGFNIDDGVKHVERLGLIYLHVVSCIALVMVFGY